MPTPLQCVSVCSLTPRTDPKSTELTHTGCTPRRTATATPHTAHAACVPWSVIGARSPHSHTTLRPRTAVVVRYIVRYPVAPRASLVALGLAFGASLPTDPPQSCSRSGPYAFG